jgi:hypothetical protein
LILEAAKNARKRSRLNCQIVAQKRKASSHPIQDRLVRKSISEPDQGGKEAFSSGIEMPAFRAVQLR